MISYYVLAEEIFSFLLQSAEKVIFLLLLLFHDPKITGLGPHLLMMHIRRYTVETNGSGPLTI